MNPSQTWSVLSTQDLIHRGLYVPEWQRLLNMDHVHELKPMSNNIWTKIKFSLYCQVFSQLHNITNLLHLFCTYWMASTDSNASSAFFKIVV